MNSVAGLIFGPRFAGSSVGVAMTDSLMVAAGAGLETGFLLAFVSTGAARGTATGAWELSVGFVRGGAAAFFTCNDSDDLDIAVLRKESCGLAVLCLVSTLS
jgi:hypothetical protein